MKIIFFLFVIFIPACSTKKIQTSEFVKEPQRYNIPMTHSFSYSRDKNETITYIINQFSNSSLQFEKPKNSLDFLTINYSPDQPEKFVDCGMTTITDMNDSKTLSKKEFINTKYSYTYNKYRRNHIDTYVIRNKLLISANIITSGDKNNSSTVVQTIFNLKVRKLISSTQGGL